MAQVNHISEIEAIKLLDTYSCIDEWNMYIANLWADTEMVTKLKSMGLSEELIVSMKLGAKKEFGKRFLSIPVFYNNMLVDIRNYNIFKYDKYPKMTSQENAVGGWILPYKEFLESSEPCYILEGEKDMLLARSMGINAYTMVSGASATPNEYVINAFEGKDIILCYDNDSAGINGMRSMFNAIADKAKSVKYVSIGEVVKVEKEDFYDFVTGYGCDVFDFYSLDLHDFEETQISERYKTIKEALEDKLLVKDLKSVITVVSEYSDNYAVPTIVDFEKTAEGDSKYDTLGFGEKRHWYLEKRNLNQLLDLIEVRAKDEDVVKRLKSYVGISLKEPSIKVTQRKEIPIYKASISDRDNDSNPINLDVYTFEKLNVGSEYLIEYRIYTFGNKDQKLVAIANSVKPLDDTDNYKIDCELLSKFKGEGSIKDRLNRLYESAKHYVAKHLNYNIWLMTDLVFNSVLDFKYGETMRGALDVFFLGDTQVGKSETTSKMSELYDFGHFLSLKTSTTTGLIGGSKAVGNSYCNTIGAIPRQHKKLAILEEFSGARPDFIKTMTDIRSSNEIRLSRVSGELRVPCKLRMITISNPINDDNGNPRFLNTFPNGVQPLNELIKSAEDVSRYDGFLLIPKVEKRFNPFEFELTGTPIDIRAYRHKIKWVQTRKVENVVFAEGVEAYIWDKAEELNDLFECNFPLFGTTTSKKLARFCVALASLIVNVDSSYENIIVTREIVDYMTEYLKSIYDTPVFKLKDYANEYKSYSECSDADVDALQKLYVNNSTLLDFLSNQSNTSRSNLATVAGLENNKFYMVFNRLVALKMIRLNRDNVYPTDKFRKAFSKISKEFTTNAGVMVEPNKQQSGIYFIDDIKKEGDKENG